MHSLRELYRIGVGPSSSHTIGPSRAAAIFRARHPQAARFTVDLFGSLALTGRGHLTDRALSGALAPLPCDVRWHPGEALPGHPNGMRFAAHADAGTDLGSWTVYSPGGGALRDDDGTLPVPAPVYPHTSMKAILTALQDSGQTLWEYVAQHEGEGLEEFLADIWRAMRRCLERGLEAEGLLPGDLRLQRKASDYYMKARQSDGATTRIALRFAYALAVSEENAAGGEVVTAPTCGAAGVLPAVLKLLQEDYRFSTAKITRALATAGLIGNLIKHNASISGAEVGCQGEVGSACAMAAAAATQLLGGSPSQVEYAAEMGLEHHLGLTCDPVGGYVQIPCIERNAMAASRALDCAVYAMLSDGRHCVSFDDAVAVLAQTGHDLQSKYRETATGGLAARIRRCVL